MQPVTENVVSHKEAQRHKNEFARKKHKGHKRFFGKLFVLFVLFRSEGDLAAIEEDGNVVADVGLEKNPVVFQR